MHISQLLNIRSSSSLALVAIFSIIAVAFITSPVSGVPIDSSKTEQVSSPKHYLTSSPDEALSIVLPRKNNSSRASFVKISANGVAKKITRRRRLSASNETSTTSTTTERPKRDASSAANLTLSSSSLTNFSSKSVLDSQASSVYSLNSSPDPLLSSVNNLFDSIRRSYQLILTTAQRGLLSAIGIVDQTVGSVQDAVENSSFTLVLEGQKVSAKLYDLAPPAVNRWIQRVGTSRDNKIFQQAGRVLNQFTDSKKKWYEAWFEHEHDWHNHFQDNVWPSVNNDLRVPSLPRMNFGW